MAGKLTEIAKMLVETFPSSFGTSELQNYVEAYRERYKSSGGAECIHIGNINYIVINEDYSESEDVPNSVSPLFYSSIHDPYAIIDAKTSATLIDEVYSRITYMQRVCETNVTPDAETVKRNLKVLIPNDLKVKSVNIDSLTAKGSEGRANIFQCYLVKDTGVSASTDTYSFMLKNGVIKEIPSAVMNKIRRIGQVKLLKDSKELQENSDAIQSAVYKRFSNGEVDIQSINVKSIFEIRLDVAGIHMMLQDAQGRVGMYDTSYIAGEHDEFASLNANIHTCNSCGNDIVDVRDPSKIYKLHINTDALDEGYSTDNNLVYEVGCEDCLEKCPACGSWHFNYSKFVNSGVYEKIKFARGREFVKQLREINANYCACREGIEWVYNEESGTESEHDVITVDKMTFINFANEVVATYDDYKKFYDKEFKSARFKGDAFEEAKFAKRTLGKFRSMLARKYDMDDDDIKITNGQKCGYCSVCRGKYYGVQADDYNFKCDVCKELTSERRHMVTRIDGIVFMRGSQRISRYLVTKHGNLKKISSTKIDVETAGGSPKRGARGANAGKSQKRRES